MIPEFLKKINSEIVADGKEPMLIKVEFIPFEEWPAKIKYFFASKLEEDKKANIGLDILGIENKDERIKKFAFCKSGGFDNKPDIDQYGNFNPEYWDCPLREKCNPKAQRLLCGYFKTKKGVLSPREIDVIKLVAEDLSDKEIADKLNVSYNTIASHRRNITKKIDCNSKNGIVRFAIENGIII